METRGRTFNRQIAEEAASWFVDFSSGEVEAGQREEFNRWLRTSPEHVRAYLQVAAFWEEADLLKVDAAELHRIADGLAAGNVVSLRPPAAVDAAPASAPAFDPDGAVAPQARQPGRRWAIAAGVLLSCAITAAAFWMQSVDKIVYATNTGEQRSVTLSDGSIVQLNARSRVKIAFSDEVRNVELLEGQALFEVAKNPSRPFVVLSGTTRVRAVGTQFDVYRKPAGTVVTVVEGRVAVSSANVQQSDGALSGSGPSAGIVPIDEAVLLSAGEQLMTTASAILPPKSVDVAAATAWMQKKLVFESTPLADVIAEFNRQSRRQIVIEDAVLEDVHISGVFAATSVDQFVEFLEQRFPVQVTRDEEQIRVSRRQ